MAKKKSAASAAQEPKFDKDTLLTCRRFHNEKDLISALLDDGKQYTIPEVDQILESYLKGKVN